MSTDYFSHDTRPEISLPLTRQRSRGVHIPDVPRPTSPPPRPTSPPPRGNRAKSGIFALMRRSNAAELERNSDYDEEEDVDSPAKVKGKGKDRWSKRASRKAPIPPPRERGESEELDWERIKTLPRVRLVPPEDEGEPIFLYPIPHPSLLVPLRRPQSPPTLLAATVAATLITTEPRVASPPPTPPRQTSPPSGVALNSLAHATSIAQDHGHWIGMSDKFILPPPIFSRGPSSFGRPAATRGIIMPKTRRQVEADMGRRMSMVEQRKRDSLELERFTLLPPLEEAAQSPPNVMMPPVDEMDMDPEGAQQLTGEDEDEIPLGKVRVRARPSSPPDRETYEAMMNIHSITPFDFNIPNENPTPIESQVLGPAIELKSISKTTTIRSETPPIPETPLTLIAHIRPTPPVHIISLPTPPPPPPTAPIEQPVPTMTRPKRSKSLTAILSRSSSDDGPPRALPLPSMPPLKRQKSLKKLFFSTATDAPPPLPAMPDLPPSPRNIMRPSLDLHSDQPEAGPSKKGKSSRTKAKPPLRIDIHPPHPNLPEDPKSGFITPALGTASSSTNSEAYPLTPGTARPDRTPIKAQSAGGIRGISKRFSLSNIGGAFRKKSSISGMIPVPSETEVPMVPDLPAVYKKSAAAAKGKSRWKGKEKEVVVEDVVVAELEKETFDPIPQSRKSSFRSERRISIESTEEEEDREESYGSPIAGPSRRSSAIDYPTPGANHIGLSSLGTEPFDILDSDFEFPPISPPVSPAPVVDDSAIPTSLPHSRSLNNDHFHDLDMSSLSSCCSLDAEEQPSIVHAHLMQVSPTTIRNPGVSLQDFLGTAPSSQIGILVASPDEKRRSMAESIMGPLLLAESPVQDTSLPLKADVEEKKEEVEKKEKSSKAKRPVSIPPPLIDLRGQYLKGIGPSGSRGAQQLLNMTLGSLPPSPVSPIIPNTVLASAAPIQSPTVLEVEPIYPEPEDTQSEGSIEQETEGVPETPCLEELEKSLLSGCLPNQPSIRDLEDHPGDTSQSSSIDSDLILVEAPPPSPPLLPVDLSSRAASRASTPRSRFTTPEALLRLFASPLGGSRLSRAHPTPGSNGSSKSKKGMAVEGLPISAQDDGGVNWTSLLSGTQLESLHFDSLGLDISFGSEKEGIAIAI